ncbi:MAG: hypothetical protein VW802_01425 [Rhodospirillaceae bacterium]|jgi:hypothetical protein
MSNLLNAFSPTADQLLGLLSLAIVLILFSVIGAAATGQRRFSGVDIFVGWGVTVFIFVLFGTFTNISFKVLAFGIFAVAFLSSWFVIVRDRRNGTITANANQLWRIIVLAIPFLLLVTAMRASQWDEFSHWLPNAQFIYHFDAFPQTNLPKNPSALPAYPYGLALVTYLASKLAGHFVENTSAILNILLLFIYAVILTNIITESFKKNKCFTAHWSLLALCMLGVTILSTTFVQKIVLTSYADSTTSVTLAVVAVLSWKILNNLAAPSQAEGNKTESSVLAWQCGLVIALFVYLKQTNLVLLVLLFSGLTVVALRDPAIRIIEFIKLWPKLLLPGLIVYVAWRYHVSQHFPYGEFSLLPYEKWLIGDAFNILGRMASIALKKTPYFLVMLAIAFLAIRSLFLTIGPAERLFILVASVFLGFNFFLWLMYIAAFGVGEGLRAASFWRYNTQLGLLAVTGAAYGLAMLWKQHSSALFDNRQKLLKALTSLPVILVLALPFALHQKLRFDVRPQKDHMRDVGQELANYLPKNSMINIVDLHGNGFTGKVLIYELTAAAIHKQIKVPVDLRVQFGIKTPEQFENLLKKFLSTYMWIHQPLPLIETTLGIKLAPYASHLLKRKNGTWDHIKSWPYKGYKDPHSLPD